MLLSSLFSHDPATTEISTLSLHDALPIFEIVEALLASQPLGGTHSAFGETTAGFRVVAEINRVIRRIENNFMHAHDVAFAKGDDLKLGPGCFFNCLPQH